MQQEVAETIALQALGWLATDEELRPVFMGASGVSAEDMRTGATDSAFLISLLDFIMMDDAWVIRFCDSFGHPYEAPMQARQALPGGAQLHWT
ncbi:DUF3572 domain-containing protein [Algirhabdus cladophorae]|uniref:DUF3572 domain-containing protein n=1 Tax=Algirhabdus cladophorae TaxID=3377108 RepID=UPI003B8485CD